MHNTTTNHHLSPPEKMETELSALKVINPNEEFEEQLEEPKDSYHIAYMIHFLLGAGYLVPWNAFITAVDYFQYLYPTKHINKVFSVGYMSAAVAVLLTLLCWSKSCRIQLPSVRTRMNVGQALFISALMVAPVTDWIDHGNQSSKASNVAFLVLISMVMVSGLADGLVGGSLVGATGELPGRYMQAVFAGNATAGLMVSILRIITKASVPHTPQGLRTSSQLYFVFSALIVLICVLCTNVLDKLPIIRYYRNKSRKEGTGEMKTGRSYWKVVKKIRWQVTAGFVIYVISLSIFPGYLSENVSSERFKDWYPIILITTFNVGDFVGKCLTAIYLPKGSKGAVWCCFGRVVFYPLFMGCIHGPHWMGSEIPVIGMTLMLGVSNGYLTSVLMIMAPKTVPVEESEVVGIAMETALVIGLVVGSAFGWLWNLIS